MRNKVLVELFIPELDEVLNLYLPANRKIGNIIGLICKGLYEASGGIYKEDVTRFLYSKTTGEMYPVNSLLRETDIRNGSAIVLL